MQRKLKYALVAGAIAVGAAGVGTATVGASSIGDDDASLQGAELEQASRAALAHTGGGRVTEAEADDDGGTSRYEVEVTLDDGTQVEVDLDESFTVIGSEPEDADDANDTDDD